MSIEKRPVDAIKHGKDKRVLIPTTELAGEEKMAAEQTNGKACYQAFRHDFDRGRDPELYWLGKYRNDDNATADAEIQIDTRSLYVHEDIQPERLINNLDCARSAMRRCFSLTRNWGRRLWKMSWSALRNTIITSRSGRTVLFRAILCS